MLHTFSGQEILHIWETGLGQHPTDQALTILATAFPDTPRDILAALSVGQRDSCLLIVREQIFGPRLAMLAICPACGEQGEQTLNIADMHASPELKPANQIWEITVDGYTFHFRLPNTFDLAAIAHCADGPTASRLLAQRCIVQIYHHDRAATMEALTESAITAIANRMAECDVLAEIELAAMCPACGHHWQSLFDIVTFLWQEIKAQARRYLREVHILAQAYGWREADILAMSATRRQWYIAMVETVETVI